MDGTIVELLVSLEHRYDGRPTTPSAPPADERVLRVTVRAGLGLVGDRYFNTRAHRDAAVTVMAAGSLAAWPGAGLVQARRNILLEGVDVDAATRGSVLVLDSGLGPVRLRISRPARPCAWMDATIAPGAWKALRGHGGMRCLPLSDGELRVGPVTAVWE
jgi:MOSC domain-containing protein YiiM